MNPIDIEKPILKEGESLCDGCWKVTTDTFFWVHFNFKYLNPTLLCPSCAEQYGKEFFEKQMAGL